MDVVVLGTACPASSLISHSHTVASVNPVCSTIPNLTHCLRIRLVNFSLDYWLVVVRCNDVQSDVALCSSVYIVIVFKLLYREKQ